MTKDEIKERDKWRAECDAAQAKKRQAKKAYEEKMKAKWQKDLAEFEKNNPEKIKEWREPKITLIHKGRPKGKFGYSIKYKDLTPELIEKEEDYINGCIF